MAFFFSNVRAVASPQVTVSCQEQAIPARCPESLVFVIGAGVGVPLLLGHAHACLGCCDGAHVAPVAHHGNVAVLHLVLWPTRHVCGAMDQSQHVHECPGVWHSCGHPTCVQHVCTVTLHVSYEGIQHVWPAWGPAYLQLTHASSACA